MSTSDSKHNGKSMDQLVTEIFEGEGSTPAESLREFEGTASNIEMAPEEILALATELRNHPQLLQELEEVPDFLGAIGHIAAHLDIVLDGSYSGEDVINLCKLLRDRLIKKRGSIIIT